MSNILFVITYILILIAYIVCSIVMIYHIFAFGINNKIGIVSTVAYIVGSIFLLTILFMNLQSILNLTN